MPVLPKSSFARLFETKEAEPMWRVVYTVMRINTAACEKYSSHRCRRLRIHPLPSLLTAACVDLWVRTTTPGKASIFWSGAQSRLLGELEVSDSQSEYYYNGVSEAWNCDLCFFQRHANISIKIMRGWGERSTVKVPAVPTWGPEFRPLTLKWKAGHSLESCAPAALGLWQGRLETGGLLGFAVLQPC